MFLNSWRQRRWPVVVTEDSIGLRVLVQSLVIVGILATDVAAETQTSLWAVPLSILGGMWSWYRRRERNLGVKFVLAVGMLVALAAFFGRLVGELNDTRVILAQLLIEVQVLHSFDLPTRKDLGYSMAIGLILLGVAGTLSQTLAFAPMLLIFLALALPTLMMDYRSRLGLLTPRHSAPNQRKNLWRALRGDMSPKRLGLFFLAILALGMVIFAAMPRFPGYQLQTLPVSSPIQIPEGFDARRIVNPGYPQNGTDEEGNGSGARGGKTGPGQVDETFYYGFNSTMNQNLRGVMKPKVVMRVRSQAQGFWRVLAFDKYTGEGWEISRNDDITVQKPLWSNRFSLPGLSNRSRTQEVIQTYTVVTELPNLIPVLAEPEVLYFPTPEILMDPEGGLRSPVNLADGLTYSVISEVPYRDRTALNAASTKYPQAIRDYYLQVPAAVSAQVRPLAEEILQKRLQELQAKAAAVGKEASEVPQDLPNYEKALYLAQYLKQRYARTNQTGDLPFLLPGEDLVEAFLFRWGWGYPDHYATVLTVMLRSLGIPARLVAGYGPGQFNPFTGYYEVRNTDAYAMTEVYFPEYGWFAFDPIPGHDVEPPSVEDYQPFSVLRQFWRWVAGWLPSPIQGFFTTLVTLVATVIFGFFGWLFGLLLGGWQGLFGFAIVLTMLGFCGWLIWSGVREWLYRLQLRQMPPMKRLYRQMLDALAAKGYRKGAAVTPLEFVEKLRHQQAGSGGEGGDIDAAAVEEISRAYVRWRYGGEEPDYQVLQQRSRELKASISFRRRVGRVGIAKRQ
ncbi:MAG TPA: DUF3488 domain-containing protein [Oscillatoriaceae cyanobacterium M33_DOE_052]|uniref:DUF3488 domain-containing protein n=1 Tax=Planktothricoides sp. SpSt-374 TaxID=2282167 RepID=A0A7C3ZP55_9CYAN|nr:DUF3488 domain-containing protein [Oscillatoriaceae cyanobacterium M33_DOE_052]